MAYRALVTVAGFTLPDPSTYNANTGTIVDEARNAQGEFIGSVIRDDVAKIEMTWNKLTVAQWSQILKLFRTVSGGRFTNTVTFLNQDTGSWETRKMYVSDRSASCFIRDKDGNIRGWTGCSLALVEV